MAGLRFSADPKAFLVAFQGSGARIAHAATAAMRRVSAEVKTQGAADIARAGFNERWQKALSARAYPENGDAIDPACVVVHRIPYSGVFEDGATIIGSPLLWLPLPSARKYLPAGRAPTPQRFKQAGLKLISIGSPGGRPLLAVEAQGIAGSTKQGGRTFARALEPVFFGVPSVSITQKFHIAEVCRAAAARLPEFYEQAVKDR
jgi:hypothetical protein